MTIPGAKDVGRFVKSAVGVVTNTPAETPRATSTPLGLLSETTATTLCGPKPGIVRGTGRDICDDAASMLLAFAMDGAPSRGMSTPGNRDTDTRVAYVCPSPVVLRNDHFTVTLLPR